jgi:hypothetical protein
MLKIINIINTFRTQFVSIYNNKVVSGDICNMTINVDFYEKLSKKFIH